MLLFLTRTSRFDRHPKASLGVIRTQCTFPDYMKNLLQVDLNINLYVCGQNEPVECRADPHVGIYSNKDSDIVVTHDWGSIYYGVRIASKVDEVAIGPNRKVHDLFDVPATLNGDLPDLI
jgi:hypothetical protein